MPWNLKLFGFQVGEGSRSGPRLEGGGRVWILLEFLSSSAKCSRNPGQAPPKALALVSSALRLDQARPGMDCLSRSAVPVGSRPGAALCREEMQVAALTPGVSWSVRLLRGSFP